MADYNLITVDEVRVYLDVSKPDYDDLLTVLVAGVSAIIESYCDRQFVARDYTEYQDGNGDYFVLTDQWPINTITSLYDDTDRLWGDTTLIDVDDYTFDTDEGRIELLNTSGIGTNFRYYFTEGIKNIKIAYNAGYSTVPSDLKLIMGEVVSKKFKAIRDKRVGITNISSAGEGIGIYLGDLLPEHKMLLDSKYKKRGAQ